ncbi:spindle assembly abnormal protein 6 homolog [Procambarus clarkii]|uniref:spindle assembly abnormal protein 6 homolog n=1 Tax=Procambarus clarkii TaxID=6728 RepID=UPI0037438421
MDSKSSQSVEEGEFQKVLTRQQMKQRRQDVRRSVDSDSTHYANVKRMKNDAETDQTSSDERTERCQEGEGQRRWRLLFPSSFTLACHHKLMRTVKLGREHRKFDPLLKEGVNRRYLTAQATRSHANTQDSGSDSVTVSEVATVAQKEGHNDMVKEVWAELRKVGEFLRNLGQRIESIEAKLNVQVKVKESHKTVKESQDILFEDNNEILSDEMKENTEMETQSPEELATSHGNINMDSKSSQSVEEGEFQKVLTRQQKKRRRQDVRRSVESDSTHNANDKRMKNDAETDQTSSDERTELCQEGVGQRRWRLLFPSSFTLAYHHKLLWTVKLGREHRKFEPLLKEGVNRRYLTVGSMEAVVFLSQQGYDGVVMQILEGNEKLTKGQATCSLANTQDSGSDSVTVSEVATVAQKEGHNDMVKEVWAELRKVGEFLRNLEQRIESIEAKLNVQVKVKESHKTVKESQDILFEDNNEILSDEMKESEDEKNKKEEVYSTWARADDRPANGADPTLRP